MNVPPRRSSSRAWPARASALSRSISRAIVGQVLAVGVADHRHDQAGRRGHGDADVVAVVQHDLAGLLVERGVDDRHFLQRRDHRLDEERQVGQLHAGRGERLAQAGAQPDQLGDVALIDVAVVRDGVLGVDHVLGDLAAEAGQLDARAGRAVVEPGGDRRRHVLHRRRPVPAGGRCRSSTRMRPSGPLPWTDRQVDAELAGQQPHRRRRLDRRPRRAVAVVRWPLALEPVGAGRARRGRPAGLRRPAGGAMSSGTAPAGV